MIEIETKFACRRYPVVLALVLAVGIVSCQGKHSRVAVQNEEETSSPQLASMVRMADPAAKTQLISGFYAVENNSWRWTAGKFSALLRTPPGAAQGGATVTFAFTIPDIIVQKLGPISLTAMVNGMVLKTEQYEKPGTATFAADLLPAMLTTDSVKVDFVLDKSLPPGTDKRELGVIATSVGISPK